MTDDKNKAISEEINSIYNDTAYFVDAITSEYGFYGSFINSVGDSSPLINVQKHHVKKNIESMWVEAIEAYLPAIDSAIRNHNTGIKETEEVLPVEFSNHITEKSLRHLAQHTDYISRIEDDMIIPSKLLNVYYEEDKQTYENKFINTLLDRLMFFIERRYNVLSERGLEETKLSLDFEAPFIFGNEDIKIKLSIETAIPEKSQASSLLNRIANIRKTVGQYINTPFIKSLEGAKIKPPIMRTNAIMKNKYLSQCLKLWDFIETYDKVGYSVETDDSSEIPNDNYTKQLYSLLSMQYFLFTYNMNDGVEHNNSKLNIQKNDTINPKYIKDIEIVNPEKFDIYDTEYRKIVNVIAGPAQSRLSPEEIKIKNAVSNALKSDKVFVSLYNKINKSSSGKKISGEKHAKKTG